MYKIMTCLVTTDEYGDIKMGRAKTLSKFNTKDELVSNYNDLISNLSDVSVQDMEEGVKYRTYELVINNVTRSIVITQEDNEKS